MLEQINIVQADLAGVKLAVDWAALEGWNPGRHDAGAFYRTDPSGFFIAYIKDEPVGVISAVAYDEEFGFIGFFIVKPEYRGHRIGLELGNAAMRYLGQRNIGVDGVEAKVSNYETYGFKMAYRNIRYEGNVPKGNGHGMLPLELVDMECIEKYDRTCFPVSRTKFLLEWLNLPESFGVGKFKDNKLAGYGVIRKCLKGWKLGPVFADNIDFAREIIMELAKVMKPEDPVYLDVPETNYEAVRLAEEFGMKQVFATARMYNRKEPEINIKRIFGVTTFELG
jgi:ribosomal protein S18 acetylase RimI-like enzyme